MLHGKIFDGCIWSVKKSGCFLLKAEKLTTNLIKQVTWNCNKPNDQCHTHIIDGIKQATNELIFDEIKSGDLLNDEIKSGDLSNDEIKSGD